MTLPEGISGTSLSNNFWTKEGSARDKIICLPLGVSTISFSRKVILWLRSNLSFGTRSDTGIIPSVFPKSTLTSAPSKRSIIPLTIEPTLSVYSPIIAPFSASLIFWCITCFAVCAAILPKPGGVTSFFSTPLKSTFPSSSGSM